VTFSEHAGRDGGAHTDDVDIREHVRAGNRGRALSGAGGDTRVVVVDDHDIVLSGIVSLLERQPDLVVVGVAATIGEALRVVEAERPDVVVMDYQLPDGSGAAATNRICTEWPDVRVVMLTGFESGGVVCEAARAGAVGFVPKSDTTTELVRVIRSVAAGLVEITREQLDLIPAVDQLVVHYQPIIDLYDGGIVGFEALVRGAHPVRGLVPPAEFIQLAEGTPLIVDIGERVRRDACRQAASWDRRFPSTPPRSMSVNLSPREMQMEDLPDRLAATLDLSGLSPARLTVEVTETFFAGDTANGSDTAARRLAQI
jgi:CheY-like chemotaxis protein